MPSSEYLQASITYTLNVAYSYAGVGPPPDPGDICGNSDWVCNLIVPTGCICESCINGTCSGGIITTTAPVIPSYSSSFGSPPPCDTYGSLNFYFDIEQSGDKPYASDYYIAGGGYQLTYSIAGAAGTDQVYVEVPGYTGTYPSSGSFTLKFSAGEYPVFPGTSGDGFFLMIVPLCWVLSGKRADGTLWEKRGPGRLPSRIRVPWDIDEGALAAVEDGAPVDRAKYRIVREEGP